LGVPNKSILFWIILDLIAATILLFLIPFQTPAPAFEKLSISPSSSGTLELIEIRIGNVVQPLFLAKLSGNGQFGDNSIILKGSSGQINFEIKRPSKNKSEISIIFSEGPESSNVDLQFGRNYSSLVLKEVKFGERITKIPSLLPWETLNNIVFILAVFSLTIVLLLIGILFLLPVGRTDPSYDSTTITKLNKAWQENKHIILPPLFIYSILPVLCAIQFPMELEMRESTKWLHALALSAGINIYDNSQTAFINMSHGPMDALIKSLLVWIGNPILTLRWAVLVFPIIITIVALKLIPKTGQYWVVNALVLAMSLELVLITHKVILIGQTETSAALFLVLTLFFIEISTSSYKYSLIISFLTGITWMCTFLTNWRYGPILLVAGILFVVRSYFRSNSVRSVVTSLFSMVVGGSVVFLIILSKYFRFDVKLYYQHFFGFYKDFGEKLFLRDFLIPQVMGILFVVVLIVLYLFDLMKNSKSRPFRIELAFWTVGLIIIYLTTLLAFYLNGAGGGYHYHYPIYIYLWFMFFRFYETIKIPKAILSPVIILVLLISNTAQTALFPLLGMKDAWENANKMRTFLQTINKTHTLWTEDIHLFKEKWKGETIDMGDYDSFYRKSGLFPAEFNNLVDNHFDDLQKNPPKVAIVSEASSPELIKYVLTKNYREVIRYSGWLNMNFGIWFSPDISMPVPELSQ